ncbi:hypothetical protein [Flavobacterium sp.]|uniref:hypothetical protein n=1 Tax=Flavobacterium sp. TaxID=239 RepID=UPI003A9282EB
MKKLSLLLFTTLLLSSCASKIVDIALKKTGVLDSKVTLKTLTYKDKVIVFAEMMHLGKVEFYKDVKSKIDSLENEGYFVFYEGLYLKKSDRVIKENDTINYLKFRKILNLDPLLEYSKVKPLSEYVSKYDLIDQPDYTDLGLTPENSQPVDLPITVLINEFEKEKGPVILNDCDYKTPLGSENYTCETVNSEDKKFFLKEIVENKRNINLVDKIKTTTKKKILILYGKKHYTPVEKLLKEHS